MKKCFIFLVLFQSILLISSEEEVQNLETADITSELQTQKENVYDLLKSPYSPPEITYSFKSPKLLRITLESQIGTLRYKVNTLTLADGKKITFKKNISSPDLVGPSFNSSFLDEITKKESNIDNAYGKGYFTQQSLGLAYSDQNLINLSGSVGYYQSRSSTNINNKKAEVDKKTYTLNIQGKTETNAFLVNFYWNTHRIPLLHYFSCTPFIGLGTGVAYSKHTFFGHIDSIERQNFLYTYWTRPSYQQIRYLIDNKVFSTEFPFIFDIGCNIGNHALWAPIFDCLLGFRLYEVASSLTKWSFYTGLKVSF